jgi:adenylyltransferase/sulfurtransferase
VSIAAANSSQLNDYSRLEQTVFAPGNVCSVHALVVGAGALGNEVVKALGLIGVGTVTIVDPDLIEPSNLTRSIFLRHAAPGAGKAVTLAAAAAALFPDTRFTAFAAEITDVGFGLISTANLVFGCVDSDLARLEIACISTKLDLPVCDGGLGTPNYSHGRVSFFPGRAAACYGCTLSRRKRAELLTFWDATVRPCATPPGATPNSSTPTMAALTGALQADTGLRRFLEHASAASALELTLDPAPRLESIHLPLSSACPFHAPALRSLLPAGDRRRSVRQFLQASGSAPGVFLALDWPVCVDARCRACLHRWAPLLRCARFRRHGVCPSCASRDILELATIRAIEPASRWSELSLLDLGVPEHHLVTVRSLEP